MYRKIRQSLMQKIILDDQSGDGENKILFAIYALNFKASASFKVERQPSIIVNNHQ